MINAKIIYSDLLLDSRISSIVPEENIFDAYPESVETFPCIIFLDSGQNDVEFADNLPIANKCNVNIHIFTKAISGYPTTSEIGLKICEVFKENYFTCTSNIEQSDFKLDVRHRVLIFSKEFFA